MELEKAMRESYVEMTEIVLPNDANLIGTAFGGKIAQWIDIAGSIAAIRHCRNLVVTASMGQIDFVHRVKVGQIVILHAWVVAVGNTSMEVLVEIYAEDPLTGHRDHTGNASLTSVAVDKDGKKIQVPRVRPETVEEKKMHEAGLARIQARKRTQDTH